mmetsp:Transcript_6676/g.8726  ORF Transcript_6676/g.8726 Transcript_6676/m.8726 type:complete len:161 (-) Transcript_6676:134-616(-)
MIIYGKSLFSHTIHIIHPTSVIIMNVDIDPNSITASDYALICTHWKAPDPNKAGKELTLYRCPKEACVSIPTKRFAKCNNNLDGRFVDKRRRMTTVMIQVILFLKENRNLWNDNMVYQSIYNCQQNATNRRRREKEEQFFEQRSMMQATAEAIELPHDNL